MSKKLWIPIVLALVAALLIGSVAYAAGDTSNKTDVAANPEGHRNTRSGLGQVTAIGDSQFTVQLNNQNTTLTILVDEQTKFSYQDGDDVTFADLEVGMWVAGRVVRNDQGQALARVVILLPEGFDPTQYQRARGEVTAVGASSFTLNTPQGEALTFQVDGSTQYFGEVQSMADLQAGMQAGVAAKKLDDGTLLAVAVRVKVERVRHAGEVTAVGGTSLTLETRQGEMFTFDVDANTKFLSRDGSVDSLSDVAVGMIAVVSAKQLEDGSYLAVRVAAHERPLVDLKVAGKVSAVDTSSFTIKARSGQLYTFQVDENTHFRSRHGKVNSLEDLKTGMVVGVGAQEMESGQYLALAVVVVGKK